MPPKLTLDHIAVSAPSLEAGIAFVRESLGIDVPSGGAHPLMGTHNHLMRLGEDEFLEIIAVDPAAPAPKHPRWFGLDRNRAQPPRLATWVLRTPDIDAALAAAQPSLGLATELTRGTLSWRISIPDDGSMPFEGAHPTFLQWPPGPLPGAAMPDLGCRLLRLTVHHPNATEIAKRLAPLFADDRVTFVAGDEIRLAAEIETPNGLRRLI
ncbi:VOC family protein [Pelagibius litoralis]|uniref:VOC family protein n=1 Tax=Pelagibius litoralis TaxID=374515 RepID=A0A967EVX8_9PROT|nr:VOC family protein [Pelagibius litoralis]NIA68644.1 VOC family protein [Pelagibius litoralis]